MTVSAVVAGDPILGTTVGDTVERIIGDAVRTNTAEGWHDAGQQLWGIERLITTMRPESGDWGVFYVIALANETRRCDDLAESAEMRAALSELAGAGLDGGERR